MPECRPQRGAFETWILCNGVEISAFTGGAATGYGGQEGQIEKKPNKYRYIPPAVEGMLEIAMRACQVSSESIRMSPSTRHAWAKTALQNCRSQEFEGRADTDVVASANRSRAASSVARTRE